MVASWDTYGLKDGAVWCRKCIQKKFRVYIFFGMYNIPNKPYIFSIITFVIENLLKKKIMN